MRQCLQCCRFFPHHSIPIRKIKNSCSTLCANTVDTSYYIYILHYWYILSTFFLLLDIAPHWWKKQSILFEIESKLNSLWSGPFYSNFGKFQTKSSLLLQKKEVNAWWNVLVKCFKICHILHIRKPIIAYSVFHFVPLYFFLLNECPQLRNS